MKILLCLIVFALCACGAYSRPTTNTTAFVPCTAVHELSSSISILNISESQETLKVKTPNDASCTSLKCLKVYRDVLENLSKKHKFNLQHLVRMLKRMNLEEEEKCETEVRSLKTFFKTFNNCLSDLGRNCK